MPLNKFKELLDLIVVLQEANMKCSIRYKYNDKRADYEALWKGQRGDVLVLIDNKRYNVYPVAINYLFNAYINQIKEFGYYQTEVNIIIVKEVTKREINKVIYELIKTDFFKKLGCLADKDDWGIFEYMHNKK